MKCPRCETAMLDERERDGITVDVCGSCRGLWLDRGELEKLIARAARELEELGDAGAPARPAPAPQPAPQAAPGPSRDYVRSRRDSTPPHGVPIDRGYRDPRDYEHEHGYRYRKKKSFLDILGDVFD